MRIPIFSENNDDNYADLLQPETSSDESSEGELSKIDSQGQDEESVHNTLDADNGYGDDSGMTMRA